MSSLQVIWRAKNASLVWTDYVLIDGQSRAANVNMGPLDTGITNLPTAAGQVVPIVGATSPNVADLGNLVNKLSFMAEREFVDIYAAMKFRADYPQSLPRTGKYRELYIDADGARTEREMTTALLEPPQIVASLGVVLTIRYSLQGGLFVQAFTADS